MKTKFNHKILLSLVMLLVFVTACDTNIVESEEQIDTTVQEDIDTTETEVVTEDEEVIEKSNPDLESETETDSEVEDEEEIIVDEQSIEKFFPLQQGNSWNYLGEGMEYSSFFREVLYREDNRAQIREDNTGTVMAIVYEITDEAITRIFSQGESYDDENYINAESNDNTIIIKKPLEVGNSWETGDGTREIISIDSSLETPAGEFDGLVEIQVYNGDALNYEYYKEGVGLVHRAFIGEDFEVTSSLEEYNINE